MSNWEISLRAFNEVNGDTQNRRSFSEDQIIDAACYGGYKMLEDAQRREGQPTSHHFAKGFFESFAAEEVERLFYERKMDMRDIEVVQNAAKKHAAAMYEERFFEPARYDPNNIPPMPTGGRGYSQQSAPQYSNGLRQVGNEPREYTTSGMARSGYQQTGRNYETPRMVVGGPGQGYNGNGGFNGAPRMGGSETGQAYGGQTYNRVGSTFARY